MLFHFVAFTVHHLWSFTSAFLWAMPLFHFTPTLLFHFVAFTVHHLWSFTSGFLWAMPLFHFTPTLLFGCASFTLFHLSSFTCAFLWAFPLLHFASLLSFPFSLFELTSDLFNQFLLGLPVFLTVSSLFCELLFLCLGEILGLFGLGLCFGFLGQYWFCVRIRNLGFGFCLRLF